MATISPYERWGKYQPLADASLRVHTLRAGETLTGLAHRFYGDWRLWRLIADRNTIVDARELVEGTNLLIPQRTVEKGRYASL
jgi:nucleoid-associated protein YgaU